MNLGIFFYISLNLIYLFLDSDYESDGDKSLNVEKSPEFAKILPLITPEKLITSTYSSKQKQKISESKTKIEPMINTLVPFMSTNYFVIFLIFF